MLLYFKNVHNIKKHCSFIFLLIDNLAFLTFTEPKGPFFTYDPSTTDHVCNEPMLPDPYESLNVAVKCSKARGAGEGKSR